MEQEFKLDFEQLEDWTDDKHDDLPIRGLISFYEATGIAKLVLDNKERFVGGITAIDNIACNFYTQKRIKNFIKKQWEIYSMSLVDHNNVTWNTHTYKKGEKHYARSLSKRVESSLLFDFVNYCPRINDELPDDIIVVTIPDEAVPQDEPVVEQEQPDQTEQA